MSSYNKETFLSLENKIMNIVIPSLFPALVLEHRIILSKCVFRVLLAILMCFNYEDNEFHQFEQNNYQDIKWISYLLLPYLNEQNNHLITNFNDIYIAKEKDCDINLSEPKYLHSNIQYNLFNRTPENYTEKQFSLEMFYQNYYLLINTIKTSAHKLHVNWMDILPYTTADFEQSTLYFQTYAQIEQGLISDWDPVKEFNPDIESHKLLETLPQKVFGLNIMDIYNTMSMYLYEEIVSVKWLIFDVVCDDDIYPQIYVLDDIFGFEEILANLSWDELTIDKKTHFSNLWKILLEEAKNGNDTKLGNINLKNESIKSLLKSIIIFFNFGSHYVKVAKEEGYIEIVKSFNDDGDEEKIHYSDIEASLESIKFKYIYEYMCDAVGTFSNTWYGTKILSSSKANVSKPFKHPTNIKTDLFQKQIPITYKNIYNFSKSFVNKIYFDKNKKSKLSRCSLYWVSLEADDKEEILKRINGGYGENYMEWFNIRNYLRKLRLAEYVGLSSNSETNIDIVHNQLYNKLREIWAFFIFETLTMKGILTKFKPNMYKTDQNFINRDNIFQLQKELFSMADDNKYWNNAYHYLTMKPFCELPTLNTSVGEHNYFTLASSKYNWYTAYSYDWIAQIGFCHHFINNRVIYITGATGVGKSTEIPKLFLYYSKALDYLIAPKVICTQPRKAPTESNALFVSNALGLPIFFYDENKKSCDTNNYYVQMRHSDREHVSQKRAPHGVLEYATDGSLILQINDPIGKVVRGKKSKDDTDTTEEKFTKENIYDIIMIDEAHEHKINMDLLLTYLKINIGYNNSMRLVILSATMDEDEPKYRRFYRDINDNRKYPLNTWLAENKLDRICIDRRFHISPPGIGTKYEVKEFYEPTHTEITMTQQILRQSTEGDILIFQPGSNDIKKLVIALNDITPPDVIAIPYYSDLDKEKREFVENIAERRENLKISKREDFAIANLSSGSNSYRRIIIIATNVAEASITIASLKFVIETGTQKVQLYDYLKRGESLAKTFISESSRIQRKGRVGRKSSGTVYYLYEKGKMSNNKIICEISTNNIALQLFGKLKSSDIENEFIIHDPNKFNTLLTQEMLTQYGTSGLDKILLSQYFINRKYFSYVGNEKFYDYEHYKDLPHYYKSGFDYNTLYDKFGLFYIVHPNETEISRNINGDIMDLSESAKKDKFNGLTLNQKEITSKKIEAFWKTLFDYIYIKFNDDKTQIIKTQFGIKLIELFEKLKLEDHSMFRALLFGMTIGKGEDLLRLFVMNKVLRYNPENIFQLNDKNKPDVNNTIYKNKESDSLALLQIINEFHLYLESIDIKTRGDTQRYINYLLENTTYGYTREDYLELLGPEDQYSEQLKSKIIPGSTKKIYKILHKIINDIFESEIYEKKTDVMLWCSRRQISYQKMIEYIQSYISLRTDINKNMNEKNRNFITHLKANLKLNLLHSNLEGEFTNDSKILLSLLFGFIFNVCKKINNSSYYVSIYMPSLNNMFEIGSSSKYKFKPITLMNTSNAQDYLLYLSTNIEFNTIASLNKIEPNIISLVDNIYNNEHFSKTFAEYDYTKDRVLFNVKSDLLLNNATTVDVQNAFLYMTKTIELLKTDFTTKETTKFKISDLSLD